MALPPGDSAKVRRTAEKEQKKQIDNEDLRILKAVCVCVSAPLRPCAPAPPRPRRRGRGVGGTVGGEQDPRRIMCANAHAYRV